ncbi:MAG: type I-E CRISPR-associated protein Cas7/Cse4/CasC [Acidobacteria bacterium]|nr:type I-E CRISPR-associated protein Cas7/Cse4/CasC [Acidobacteriota bacterium]
MERFVQLHLLTAYPPANLNRDDLGRPKTAIFGGQPRLRISSQSLKRAWRTSDVFLQALGMSEGFVEATQDLFGKGLKSKIGIRTRRIAHECRDWLITRGMSGDDAESCAKAIAGTFAQLGVKDDPLATSQLVVVTPAELAAIAELLTTLADQERSQPSTEELDQLVKNRGAADVALFGRMLTQAEKRGREKKGRTLAAFSMEAAAQVAHAISVNAVQVEDDFFTAVDDLKPAEEDMGAGHMGDVEFGAGVFYLYLCIDRELLVENLDGDRDLAGRAIRALTEAAATVAPRGKQATFASRARASYILAEKGDTQPRSLAVAFLDPVRKNPMLPAAIEVLEGTKAKLDSVYGETRMPEYRLNAVEGTGTIAELLDFVAG